MHMHVSPGTACKYAIVCAREEERIVCFLLYMLIWRLCHKLDAMFMGKGYMESRQKGEGGLGAAARPQNVAGNRSARCVFKH